MGTLGTPEVVIMSQSVWDTLSEEDKELFREAALESVEVQRQAWADLTKESKETVLEAGSEFSEVDDIKAWREAVQPVYDKYGEELQ